MSFAEEEKVKIKATGQEGIVKEITDGNESGEGVSSVLYKVRYGEGRNDFDFYHGWQLEKTLK